MKTKKSASARAKNERASPTQIVARDLVKTYYLGGSTIGALQGINVEIARGE